MALSKEEMEGLERMSHEDLGKLLAMIREARAMFRVGGAMPSSAFEDLVKAVPDKLVREVVADLRSGRAEPGFLPPTGAPPKEKGIGWVKPLEHSSPSGLRYIDQAMDMQDRLDKIELEKRLRGG